MVRLCLVREVRRDEKLLHAFGLFVSSFIWEAIRLSASGNLELSRAHVTPDLRAEKKKVKALVASAFCFLAVLE